MRKYILFLLFVFIFISPYYRVFADSTLQNVGFVSNPIWYSSDPFYEGDMVKIYTFIFNGRPETLSGSVDFYDGDVILGKKSISISGNTGMDVSISWKVTMGDHKIYAKISSPKILVSGKYESVVIENAVTDTDTRTVPKKILSVSQSTAINGPQSLVQDDGNDTYEKILQQLTNAENAIKNGTPDVIQKPVTAVADGVESFRMLADGLSEDGKVDAQTVIDGLQNTDGAKVSSVSGKESASKDQNEVVKKNAGASVSSGVQKPWQYVKLYFWSLVHFVTTNKVVFYGLIILILFFSIRFIIRKVF